MSEKTVSKQNAQLRFIGLGLMGSRFFRRLHSEGWKIRGWNRSHQVTIPLEPDGLDIAESLVDLVHGSEILLSSLGNDEAVHSAYFGEAGVRAAALLSGLLLLTFGVSMTLALGIKAPLNFAVLTGIEGALLLASRDRLAAHVRFDERDVKTEHGPDDEAPADERAGYR